MNNTTIPSPPSSPTSTCKRKRSTIVLPPVCTKRSKSLAISTVIPATANTLPLLDVQLLRVFLDQGGLLTTEKQGRCLLCCACQYHSTEALQLLIERGLPCQYLCKDDMSALHMAATVGFIQGLSFLLYNEDESRRAVNINGVTKQDYHTPLYRAVQANQSEAVAYLLEKGARLDLPDKMGRFPLHVAIMNRHLGCVSLLLDYQHLSKNNPSHTDIIWQTKSSISTYSCDDQSSIEDAVMAGCASILERLIQSTTTASLSPTSNTLSRQKQADLLDLAVHWNRLECLELLIRLGYDVNYAREKNSNISSLLYKAVQQRKLDMVRLLRKAGAVSCFKGHNPCLIYAANHGFLEMVPLLLTPCTSNDCIEQAVTLAAPLNVRQQLLSTIIHTLKNSTVATTTTATATSTISTSIFSPLTPTSP